MSTFTLNFVNNTGFDDDQIWILAKGQSLSAPPAPAPAQEAFFSFSGNTAALTASQAGNYSTSYAVKLSSFTSSTVSGVNTYALSFPGSQGCRIYVSVGKALLLSSQAQSNGAVTIPDPAFFNCSDPNYAVIFDKIEFSLTSSMYIDTTAVDFFGMPISLTANSMTENSNSTGLYMSRSTIVNTYQAQLTGKWHKLFSLYPPVAGTGSQTVLRVSAPNNANGNPFSMLNPPKSSDNNFDSGYLDTYLTSVWNNTSIGFDVDCSELSDGNYSATAGSGEFTFTPPSGSDNAAFNVAQPSSNDAFACANGSFTATNGTPQAVCIRELAVAVNTGMMPITPQNYPNALLNKSFFRQNRANMYPGYQNPPHNPNYNLYSCVTHYIPQDGGTYPASAPNKMYAFAYDDAAGMDGTLKVAIGSGNYVCVNLKSLAGLTIPDPDSDDTNTYNVTFSAPVGGSGTALSQGYVLQPGTTTQVNFPNTSGTPNVTVNGMSSPFSIWYGADSSSLQEYTVYVALQSIYNTTTGNTLAGAFVWLDPSSGSVQINLPNLS